MKKIRPTSLLNLLLIGLIAFLYLQKQKPESPPAPQCLNTWEVCFTPGGDCTHKIVNEIQKAQKHIRVQAYSFTSRPITEALIEANKRGVDVQVIVDESNEEPKYQMDDFLKDQGVAVFTDKKHAIAHNKVILIDEKTVITGSFNFTKAAQERNAENLIILKDSKALEAYQINWQKHREHSL